MRYERTFYAPRATYFTTPFNCVLIADGKLRKSNRYCDSFIKKHKMSQIDLHKDRKAFRLKDFPQKRKSIKLTLNTNFLFTYKLLFKYNSLYLVVREEEKLLNKRFQ